MAEALWTLDRHGDFARLVDQYPQTKDLPDIQLRLGLMYLRGHDGTEDLAEALRWFYKAADQDHSGAQDALYEICAAMLELPGGTEEAVSLIAEAIGLPQAWHVLGEMHLFGRGLELDFAEAVTWLRKAAEQDAAGAQVRLAMMYYMGGGLEQDYSEGTRWFRKAAEQGREDAQFALGNVYENGLGDLKKNEAEAAKWYRKAAEQGHEEAKTTLERLGPN